jgi:hypothetical protein
VAVVVEAVVDLDVVVDAAEDKQLEYDIKYYHLQIKITPGFIYFY